VIRKHEAVSDVCVVGIEDPDGGDKIPRAWVVLNQDAAKNYSLEDIKNFTNSTSYNLIVHTFIMQKIN